MKTSQWNVSIPAIPSKVDRSGGFISFRQTIDNSLEIREWVAYDKPNNTAITMESPSTSS